MLSEGPHFGRTLTLLAIIVWMTPANVVGEESLGITLEPQIADIIRPLQAYAADVATPRESITLVLAALELENAVVGIGEPDVFDRVERAKRWLVTSKGNGQAYGQYYRALVKWPDIEAISAQIRPVLLEGEDWSLLNDLAFLAATRSTCFDPLLKLYKEAMNAHPTIAGFRWRLAVGYFAAQHYSDAVLQLETLLRQHDDRRVSILLSSALLLSGKPAEARAVIQALPANEQTSPEVTQLRALVLEKEGDMEGARKLRESVGSDGTR